MGTSLGAVKGILFLAVAAVLSSSLFRLVIDADVEVGEVPDKVSVVTKCASKLIEALNHALNYWEC